MHLGAGEQAARTVALVVTAAARGHGPGHELVARAEARAGAAGCVRDRTDAPFSPPGRDPRDRRRGRSPVTLARTSSPDSAIAWSHHRYRGAGADDRRSVIVQQSQLSCRPSEMSTTSILFS